MHAKVRAAKPVVWVLVVGHLAGCASQRADPVDLASAREHIGKTYKLRVNVQMLCPKPDLPINQEGDCAITSDGGSTTVIDIVENRGNIFPKVRIANGNEGYILVNELRHLDRQSLPSPKIGMSESEALGTNWGYPKNRNITETAGHYIEQWVFPAFGYLYVEDGVLTAIQQRE